MQSGPNATSFWSIGSILVVWAKLLPLPSNQSSWFRWIQIHHGHAGRMSLHSLSPWRCSGVISIYSALLARVLQTITRSPAAARTANRTGCQWPSKSSKIDDFHFIWKGVCHFLLVINSSFGPISRRFRDSATYSSKLFIENCGQTVANGDMVIIDSIKEVACALSDGTTADPTTYRLATIHPWQTTDRQTDRQTTTTMPIAWPLLKYGQLKSKTK